MRKLLLILGLICSLSSWSQVLTVSSIERLPIGGEDMKVAAIGPAGDFVLLTDGQNQGLTYYGLKDGHSRELSNVAGAGYDVRVANDGQTVLYRETTFDKRHLRHTSLNSLDLATGKREQLVKPTRDLQGLSVRGNTVTTVNKGVSKARALANGKAEGDVPVLSIKNRHLMLTSQGRTVDFSPNGQDKSYLWPSVSPDGQRALYCVAGMGAFVCDLKGGEPQYLGRYHAPKWYDDRIVIAMDDRDDGHVVTSSAIVALTLDGKSQTLTGDDTVAMFPQVSATRIAFSTPDGEAYIINLKK